MSMSSLEDRADPWARLPRETPAAYETYLIYRDLGPGRSVPATARAAGRKTPGICEQWSKKYTWRSRAAAWDAHLAEIASAEAEQAVRAMHRRHTELALTAQGIATARLVGDELAGIEKINPNRMTVSDVVKLVQLGVQIEREARGENVQRLQVEHSGSVGVQVDVDHLLGQLEHLAANLARVTPAPPLEIEGEEIIPEGLTPTDD